MSALDRSAPPAPAAVRPFSFPSIERRRLDNGMGVLAARHGRLPLVTATLVLDVGAAAEPAGQGGVAHLTANALDAGTLERSVDQLAWALELLGVQFGVEVGWDATVVRIVVPRERLEPALALFAEILQRPAFPEGEVQRLRDEQLADLLQRTKEPRALASDMAARFIFGRDLPYGRPLLGTPAAVERLGRAEVEAFYRAHYRPDAASLLLVGDIDADTAERLAADSFGAWSAAGAHAPAEYEVARAHEGATVFIVDRPGSVQSEIRIGDLGVERHHQDYFPLLVMNSILGGAFTSRLNLSLREKHGFTYGVRSGFAFRRRPGPFVIQTAVATEVTARAVEEALREVKRLRDDGASNDEVAAARDYLTGIMPLELQTTEQLAARLADLVIYDLPDDYFAEYRQRIAAVSPEDVVRVAREHIVPDRLAIVVVGDAGRIRPELEALGVGSVQVHTPERPETAP